jgi:hypothetical protein
MIDREHDLSITKQAEILKEITVTGNYGDS